MSFINNLRMHLSKMMLISNDKPRFFFQIGAGAGDLDERANFRDGFSENIKNLTLSDSDRIILVEPNPLNILKLKKSWQSFKNVEIYELGISTKHYANSKLPLFYADLDAPHYQVASFEAEHVLKHYPHLKREDLNQIEVATMDLESFIRMVSHDSFILLLALDIEGIDAEVLLDTNFSEINAALISFEYLHLKSKSKQVSEHMLKNGFVYAGAGVDHNGFDFLYKKASLDFNFY